MSKAKFQRMKDQGSSPPVIFLLFLFFFESHFHLLQIGLIQSTLDISNSKGIGEDVRENQRWRYRETGLKQKITQYLKLYILTITNNIP